MARIMTCRCGCGQSGDAEKRGVFMGAYWFLGRHHRRDYLATINRKERAGRFKPGLFPDNPRTDKAEKKATELVYERAYKLVLEPLFHKKPPEPMTILRSELNKKPLEERVAWHLAGKEIIEDCRYNPELSP